MKEVQSLQKDFKKAELDWEKAKDRRDHARKDLEQIQNKLEVVVDVQVLEADLEEAEELCN